MCGAFSSSLDRWPHLVRPALDGMVDETLAQLVERNPRSACRVRQK
jgi:hypothetical protein